MNGRDKENVLWWATDWIIEWHVGFFHLFLIISILYEMILIWFVWSFCVLKLCLNDFPLVPVPEYKNNGDMKFICDDL